MSFVLKTFTDAELARKIRVVPNRPCAIDEEQNVALQYDGGGGDEHTVRPTFLILNYQRLLVDVIALCQVDVDGAGGETVRWEVLQVNWSQQLTISPDKFSQILTEALHCFGKDGTPLDGQPVSVDLTALKNIDGQLRCPGAFFNTELTEADKQQIDFDAMRNPHWHGPLTTRTWTVNPERNAFLIHLGGGRGREEDECRPHQFLLDDQGVRVRIVAILVESPAGVNGLRKYCWQITHLYWSKEQVAPKTEIKQILSDALVCYGSTGLSGTYIRMDYIEVDFSKLQEG